MTVNHVHLNQSELAIAACEEGIRDLSLSYRGGEVISLRRRLQRLQLKSNASTSSASKKKKATGTSKPPPSKRKNTSSRPRLRANDKGVEHLQDSESKVVMKVEGDDVMQVDASDVSSKAPPSNRKNTSSRPRLRANGNCVEHLQDSESKVVMKVEEVDVMQVDASDVSRRPHSQHFAAGNGGILNTEACICSECGCLSERDAQLLGVQEIHKLTTEKPEPTARTHSRAGRSGQIGRDEEDVLLTTKKPETTACTRSSAGRSGQIGRDEEDVLPAVAFERIWTQGDPKALEVAIPVTVINARPMNSKAGEKSRFATNADTANVSSSVECLALEHLGEVEGWQGLHSEGYVVRSLFTLLLWDVLFTNAPKGALVGPYQVCWGCGIERYRYIYIIL
jgi:hypothetical protein